MYRSLYKEKGSWNILGKGTPKMYQNKYLKICEKHIIVKVIVIFFTLKKFLIVSFKLFFMFITYYYNIFMFIKNASNWNNIQGIKIINANNTGSSTVQQNDINWSNLILGNEALTQMKTKTNIELFIPKIKPENKLFINEFFNKIWNFKFSYDKIKSISKIYAQIRFNLSKK